MILERSEEPGKKKALTLTVIVHAALLAFLFFGVQWKRSQPEVMEVELWASRPTPATTVPPPPPPEPEVKPQPKPEPKPEPKIEPPAPKKPDIAIKEEKKKPEPKKPEPPKPEPKKPEPPKPEVKKPELPKPEARPQPKFDFDKELANETAQLKSSARSSQQLANAAAAEAEQRAASNKRGMADYASKIRGKVRGNIVLPPGIQGNPEAIFEINQLPGGEVLEVKLKRSSGNPALDAAIERAIRKSSPLPKPDDPSLFQRTLEIKYRPNEE